MSLGLPIAIINGIEKFGASKLADLLVNNDIRVIGITENEKEVDDIKETADYIIDFDEDEKVWEKAEKDGSKLTVVGVNRSEALEKKLDKLRVNWRIVNVHGVYGPGMEEEGDGLGWLINAIKLAVANKNLILPKRNKVVRLLAVEDLTEVIMRASFLSGTDKETFDIWGRGIGSEEVARVLMDEAKMTRFKVVEDDINIKSESEDEVLANWKKLRWQPKVEFPEGIKETLQYFFSKSDEESRNKKNTKIQTSETTSNFVEEKGGELETINKKRFEVIVDEDEKKNDQFLMSNFKPTIEKTLVEEDEEELIEKEFEEIKPILVKNSNSRAVNKETDELNTEKQIANNNQFPATPLPLKLQETSKKQEEEINKTEKKEKRWGWYRAGWWIMIGLWVLVAGTMIGFGVSNYVMFKNSTKLKELVFQKKFDEASKLIKKTTVSVRKRESEVSEWGLNRWLWGRRYQSLLKALEQGMIVGEGVVTLAKHSENISNAIFKEKDINWPEEIAGLKLNLSETDGDLGVLQARLAGDWGWIPGRWSRSYSDFKKQLDEGRKMLSLGDRAIEILPELLGTDGKRKEFMVLFQNENELRPGGGFIGSYAILSFEGGRLSNFEIKDVYEADGQLKGHVEPPEPIKNYLGEAGWYMRDANWQSDFGASARDIQWFLEKETGRKVDGVIGVNLAVAKSILGVIGEVYVPDFKEKINKNNLYEQAEFYSETKFFPGSNQKASFLGGVGKQLFEEIKEIDSSKRLELLTAIVEMLERNEIQIAFNNKQAAAVMAEMGWNGALYEGKCAIDRCFADYLYIVEANVGVNKANYFLYRSIDQMLNITNQSIGRVVKISYENTAKNNNWPGGDYKNYMRVYIPETSNLAEVSVIDVGSGIKTVYQSNSLKINQVKGKKEIGFLVTVPVMSKRTVEIRYVDQIDLRNKDKFSYLNYIQRQSGYGDTGLVTLISIPDGWQPVQVEPTATIVDSKLLFNQKLDRDIKMGVEIGK